jgi:hypothetical protein
MFLVVAAAGCNSPPPEMPDGGVQIAEFAKKLVETQTADNNEPTTTEDKNLVDNQDPSSFDPTGSTFPPSFFP